MLGLIFWILMLAVFGNILMFAIRMTWGITKVVFSLVLLPVTLVVLVLGIVAQLSRQKSKIFIMN